MVRAKEFEAALRGLSRANMAELVASNAVSEALKKFDALVAETRAWGSPHAR